MSIGGINYRLTKHGYARYCERIRADLAPAQVIQDCVSGESKTRAVWKLDRREGFRLVTVLPIQEEKTE